MQYVIPRKGVVSVKLPNSKSQFLSLPDGTKRLLVCAAVLVSLVVIALFGALTKDAQGATPRSSITPLAAQWLKRESSPLANAASITYLGDGKDCTPHHAFMMNMGVNGLTNGSRKFIKLNKTGYAGPISYRLSGKRLTTHVVLCYGVWREHRSDAEGFLVYGPTHKFKVGAASFSRVITLTPKGTSFDYTVYARYKR